MKKVALIGCGAISRTHAQALHALMDAGKIQWVAVCDSSPEEAKALLAEEGLELPIYTDYKEMILTLSPDAVHICTPHHLHAPMAIFALEHDVSVFLEKPACNTREELAALQKAEAESKGLLCVCFQNRFLDAVATAQEMIRSGECGKVLGGRGFVTWCRQGEYYTDSPWRGKIATEGGSVLVNQSIHTLDLLLRFLGEPDDVQGAIGNYHTASYNDTEDTAHLYLSYPDGKVGLFYATTAYCKSSKIELEIACEKKVLLFMGDKLFINGEPVVTTQEGKIRGKEVWGKGHAILIGKFYNALESGLESPVPLSSAAESLKVIWALFDKTRK